MLYGNVQAAILVKVFHQDSPINDYPEIHAGVWMKHGSLETLHRLQGVWWGVKLYPSWS